MKPAPEAEGTAAGPGWVLPAACAVGLLYFGRPVLEPLAIAGILTLTLAPLVRRIRALGLGHRASTLLAVGFIAACVAALSAVVASQVADVARELPRYRAAVAAKLEQASAVVVRPIERWEAEVLTLWPEGGAAPGAAGAREPVNAAAPIPVEVRKPHPGATATLSRLFTAMWGPVGEAAIVAVLLLFLLLGRDSIRERLIRLAGEREVARTMQALADTDEGVSRFFAALLAVNAAFAAATAAVLALLGVPHAILWGALAGLLRFVPYVGAPAAIAAIAAFAAAVDPGWTLALASVVALVGLEVVVANLVEPHVYGHTLGISPFGIVTAALFWGAIWGPVGLILSAPLTLCLVVAGRHVRALAPIAVLFGDAPGTTQGLRVYQRALAGDAQDVLDEARDYVRRHGLARYCDDMLLPAFALCATDLRAGRIDARQDASLRAVLVGIVESLRDGKPVRRRATLAESSLGAQLRKMREARHGPAQGSLDVPSRSVVLCAGLPRERDEVLTELMVRSLREAHLDARSQPLEVAPGALAASHAGLVSAVLLTYPSQETFPAWARGCRALRALLPEAAFATVRPPEGAHAAMPAEEDVRALVDVVLHSFSEAVEFASGGAGPAAPRGALPQPA